MKKKLLFAIVSLLYLGACSTGPSKSGSGREFLDSSTHKDELPDWGKSTKLTWSKENKIFSKSMHSIRGDERVNGCIDLAKLDAKENLLSEISTEVRGSIDNAQQSISENAETILGKVRSAEFAGKITGLKFTDEYFERYKIDGTERVDCYVLSEISNSDYDRIKRSVVEKVLEVDPRLKEQITKKQIDFFSQKPSANE